MDFIFFRKSDILLQCLSWVFFFILISLCFILQKAGFFIFSFNTLSLLLLASHTHIYMYIYIQFKLVDNSAQFSFFPLHERYYVFSNLFLLVIHVCKINFMWAIWLGSFCINFMQCKVGINIWHTVTGMQYPRPHHAYSRGRGKTVGDVFSPTSGVGMVRMRVCGGYPMFIL